MLVTICMMHEPSMLHVWSPSRNSFKPQSPASVASGLAPGTTIQRKRRVLEVSRPTSAMVSCTPLPLGRDTWALVPSPMTKMLVSLTSTSALALLERYNVPSRERPVENVSHVNDTEPARMFLDMHDHSRPPHVTSSCNHDNIAELKLDVLNNLVLHKVEFDSVVDFNGGVGVSDSSSVVSENVGDSLGSELVSSDFAQLEVGFLGGDSMDGETTFDVVEESEVLAGSLDCDDVYVRQMMQTKVQRVDPPMKPVG